ncbi:MAG: SRPBCC family protein [Sphaerobacteraceae bacterium]|nr:MAG: SRPBCC family protein [Sphaerobacteraceae bacterium]
MPGCNRTGSSGTTGSTRSKPISIERRSVNIQMSDDASIEQYGDLYVIRFERHLHHPIERVWAALTDPEKLQQWLAATELDPVPDGRYVLHFQNIEHTHVGRVIRYEPPYLFEHTFGDDANGVVRWELSPSEEGCLLRLSHTIYSSTGMANFMAGWHAHLELLQHVLSGSPQPWSWDSWHRHNDRYEAIVEREMGDGEPNG